VGLGRLQQECHRTVPSATLHIRPGTDQRGKGSEADAALAYPLHGAHFCGDLTQQAAVKLALP
jgi:hypothetical protein